MTTATAGTFGPALAALAAAALLVHALRGRRVDDHPLCRRCGFDLYGRPAGATRCSECGGDLTRRRAIRVGHRRPRGGLLALALPVLLLSVCWEGWIGWQRAKATDWNRHKPVWWLRRDVDDRDPTGRAAALDELATRVAAGKLTDGQLLPLIDKALAYQGDVTKPWVPAWGHLVESAHDASRLPPDQWRRYVAQAPDLSVEVRPTVRRGDPIPYRILRGPDRVAGARLGLLGTRLVPWVKVDGGRVELHVSPRDSVVYDLYVPDDPAGHIDRLGLRHEFPVHIRPPPGRDVVASGCPGLARDLLDLLADGPQTFGVNVRIG